MFRMTVNIQAILVITVVIAYCIGHVAALDNSVARTPPMGWLSWERYACNLDCVNYPDSCINDKLYMNMADRLVADGWKELGYEYVNIDDCWPLKARDATNTIVADPQRFPNGIKGVCDYLHSKGLKCGLYTDIGTLTCGGYPGLNTANNVTQSNEDIKLFASWGIDSLKVDGCYADTATMPVTYPLVGKQLLGTKRPIMYSCSWPAYIPNNMTAEVYQSLHDNCNIWRNWSDINDSWESLASIIGWWRMNPVMAKYTGPGAYNDPDMILVGNNGFSLSQQRVQMSMWSIFAAPLLMSNNLLSISAESKAIAQNAEVIAVNQDSLGLQGTCLLGCSTEQEVWIRHLSGGRVAVALLNLHTGVPGYPEYISFTAKDVGMTKFVARDLWGHKDLGLMDSYKTRVGSNDVELLLLTPSN